MEAAITAACRSVSTALGTTLAIDATESVTIVLDDQLPAGPWVATLTLKSGLVERTASATIMFPDSGAGAPVAADPASPGWLYPLIVGVAGLVILLLLLAILLFVLRRRRDREEDDDDMPGPVDLSRGSRRPDTVPA